MTADNNYKKKLEEVCDKLDNSNIAKELDVLDIKNSVEEIQKLITSTQAKVNFQDIKEKLENIAFQVDSCNDTLLKDLYNDINLLKDSASDVNKHLENLQNVQNLALTSAEFEEFQKQQLDLAMKSNESIYNELSALKNFTGGEVNNEGIKNLELQLDNLHKTLIAHMNKMASSLSFTAPTLDEIGAVVSDLNSVQGKDIKQTNNLLKEVQLQISQFQSEFNNKDFESQIAKISEIYDSLDIINAWIEKVGYINQSIENVYARLGENIDFDDVAEKVDIIYENINAINKWAMKIDDIKGAMPEIHSKLSGLTGIMGDTRNIINVVSNIKEKIDTAFFEDLDFEDISNKMDIVYENLAALNQWASKVDSVSEKIDTQADNLNEVSEKTKTISEDVIKISDNVLSVSDNVETFARGINDISDNFNKVSEDINGFSEKYNEISDKVDKISGGVNTVSEDIGIVSDKVNLISDNVDKISGGVNTVSEDIGIVSDKVNLISDNVDTLNDKFNNANVDINFISGNVEKANDNINDISDNVNIVAERINDIANTVNGINDVIENDMISSKIDLIYENISLLNEWVNKIDNLSKQGEVFDEKYTKANDSLNIKIDEITELLSNASKLVQDVPNIKDKLNELSNELNIITNTTKNDNENYVYTLLDIEADFLKLHQFMDEKTKDTSYDINALKERFTELNDDISSISVRTNKLILSADDANKEFKTYLDSFKEVIQNLDEKTTEFNPEFKYGLIDTKVSEMVRLIKDITVTSGNLNNAFLYLAEWIDATGNILNSMQENISGVKESLDDKSDTDSIKDEINSAKDDINSIKADIEGNYSNISDLIENINSTVSSLVKLNSEEITNKIDVLEKSFANYKSNDVSAIKDALTYLVNKAEDNDVLKNQLDEIKTLISESTSDDGEFLTQAATLLSEKINEIASSNAKDISLIKEEISLLAARMNELTASIGEYKSEEISEIKSQLTGIMVQLNTAVTPDIDSLNERIDKFVEDNSNNMTQLEKLMQEKIEIQAKQINVLEEKIENMNAKFDKLAEAISDNTNNSEIKDILSYIAAQMTTANESNGAMAEKLASFDTNINKIVNYIEED